MGREMLFERRAYTLRPGARETFWGLQRKWNTPVSFRPMLEHNIGYFATVAGPAERIVHLYRWDSYDQAKRNLAAITTPERMEYFVTARKLLLRQETAFLEAAPHAELSPIWGSGRDWRPGTPVFPNLDDPATLAVTETVLDFVPGGVAVYWEGYRKLDDATVEVTRQNLIGTFLVTTGPLHRVIQYRWFPNWQQAEKHRQKLEESPSWSQFVETYRPHVHECHVAQLSPSPVPWMRPLFAAIDWSPK